MSTLLWVRWNSRRLAGHIFFKSGTMDEMNGQEMKPNNKISRPAISDQFRLSTTFPNINVLSSV